MRRRQFILDGLRLTAAAIVMPLPAIARDSLPVRLTIARLEGQGADARWAALEDCPGGACAAHECIRIGVDTLAFPSVFQSVGIDVLFATAAGDSPFRIASFQRDSPSPASKPFFFQAAPTGLSGIRVQHRLDGGRAGVIEQRWLDGVHEHLAPGRYLVCLLPPDRAATLADLAVTEPGAALRYRDGRGVAFAHVGLSVTAVVA